ncbi:hypothetical protein N7467_005414 [Penicillium canescens]|nr:hypothetical protein N7467_005414 [Penicillium canescens]
MCLTSLFANGLGSNLNVDKHHAFRDNLKSTAITKRSWSYQVLHSKQVGSIKRQNQSHQFRRLASSGRPASLDEDALLALRAELSKRTIQNPSPRTPGRGTRHNKADRLEKALKEACFQKWGFVSYRRTYRSDSDWAEFLRQRENGLYLLPGLQTTVFENRERYENASTATIREDFQQWARTAVQEKQGVSPEVFRFFNIEAARYRFCLFVNEKSLQCVLQAPPEDSNNDDKFGWWKPESLEDYDQGDIEDYIKEFGSAGGLVNNSYEPIEGCTVQDVG